MSVYKRVGKAWLLLLVCLGSLFFAGSGDKVRAANKGAHLGTNQDFVERLKSSAGLKIDDVSSVLLFVLNSLSDKVLVYPTENYYYFNFYHAGVKYSGNFRLDVADRDQGKIHFAYFTTYNDWGGELKSRLKTLGPKDGVKVERIDRFNYRVSFKTRVVIFSLNDLSHVRPSVEIMADNEIYLGPVFDESAVQFFLIYNKSVKNFIYVLNLLEEIPDVLVPDEKHKRIQVSHRTGFVFYQDHLKDRLILIGVHYSNVYRNNYFDGPFDQLPDNFIKGDELKQAFIDQRPKRAGNIDRFGNAPDGNSRISIAPYLQYLSVDELYEFDECAQKNKASQKKYYACFDVNKLGIE